MTLLPLNSSRRLSMVSWHAARHLGRCGRGGSCRGILSSCRGGGRGTGMAVVGVSAPTDAPTLQLVLGADHDTHTHTHTHLDPLMTRAPKWPLVPRPVWIAPHDRNSHMCPLLDFVSPTASACDELHAIWKHLAGWQPCNMAPPHPPSSSINHPTTHPDPTHFTPFAATHMWNSSFRVGTRTFWTTSTRTSAHGWTRPHSTWAPG
mmetsp:Transcript_5211/g.11663  ORF Transcript_5211/g.11663 Transcript_5211/m.11663 type:complete len:205 (+) Transcript_5211:281-895(+)